MYKLRLNFSSCGKKFLLREKPANKVHHLMMRVVFIAWYSASSKYTGIHISLCPNLASRSQNINRYSIPDISRRAVQCHYEHVISEQAFAHCASHTKKLRAFPYQLCERTCVILNVRIVVAVVSALLVE